MLKLNPIQVEAEKLAASDEKTTVLFRGGTGSGKTVFTCYAVLRRALAYPKSRNICFRATAVEARDMLFNATFREVFDYVLEVDDGSSAWEYFDKKGMISRDPMMVKLDNGSTIVFGGLDDNQRLNKILGADYATAFISEVQNIDSYRVVQRVKGRLRQKLTGKNGKPLVPKLFMDCNPPSKRHWTYKVFIEGQHPLKGTPLKNFDKFAEIKMNVEHNLANLADGYLDDMDYDAKEHEQFVKGEWYDEVDNPMFYADDIASARLPSRLPHETEDLVHITVAIDPAISSHDGSDESGIMVVGRDAEGHGYVLDDLSGKFQPDDVAKAAIQAFHLWKANDIIAERNQGGDWLESVFRNHYASLPYRTIHASRSKELRAESTSTAYRQRRIHHCGEFTILENQLLEYEQNFNRKRKGSPDRLDALVHGFNAILFEEVKKASGRSRKVKGMRF